MQSSSNTANKRLNCPGGLGRCNNNRRHFIEISLSLAQNEAENRRGNSDILAFKSFSRRQVNVIQPSLDESLFRIVSPKSSLSGRPLRLTAADIYVALRKRWRLFGALEVSR